MTGTARVVVTLTIFATMLALVVVRPRRWSEACWTMLGAVAMLALGIVSPRQALSATLAGKNALLFLLSLLALSLLVGKSGFFDWAAIRCARMAKGNARSLYRNAFVLGAIVTGIIGLSSGWLAHLRPGSPEKLLAAAGATAFASNIINNFPAALIARSVLVAAHADAGTLLAALVGADVGPIITPFGSLATMLVVALARREGQEVRTGRLLLLGLWAAPAIVVATTLTLTLSLVVVR